MVGMGEKPVPPKLLIFLSVETALWLSSFECRDHVVALLVWVETSIYSGLSSLTELAVAYPLFESSHSPRDELCCVAYMIVSWLLFCTVGNFFDGVLP